jgi:hypothetical protein
MNEWSSGVELTIKNITNVVTLLGVGCVRWPTFMAFGERLIGHDRAGVFFHSAKIGEFRDFHCDGAAHTRRSKNNRLHPRTALFVSKEWSAVDKAIWRNMDMSLCQ